MLTVQNVTVRFGGLTAVDGVSLSLSAGQWLMLAGPNGAGKSTLLNAIAQGVRYEGRICLDGKDLRDYRPGERARRPSATTWATTTRWRRSSAWDATPMRAGSWVGAMYRARRWSSARFA